MKKQFDKKWLFSVFNFKTSGLFLNKYFHYFLWKIMYNITYLYKYKKNNTSAIKLYEEEKSGACMCNLHFSWKNNN